MARARPQEPGRREPLTTRQHPGSGIASQAGGGSRAVRWPLGHGEVDTWEGAWPGRAPPGPSPGLTRSRLFSPEGISPSAGHQGPGGDPLRGAPSPLPAPRGFLREPPARAAHRTPCGRCGLPSWPGAPRTRCFPLNQAACANKQNAPAVTPGPSGRDSRSPQGPRPWPGSHEGLRRPLP